jgi:hypothetical protein
MRVLVACEESQAVCIAFRERGHEAYSCDLVECSGGHPEWHFKQDVFEAIGARKWDLIVAFPPCTDLTVMNASHWKIKQADGRQPAAISFVKRIFDSNDRVCIENPVGALNTFWKKPTQIIHPSHFGDPYMKRTCLWLKGLPRLEYDRDDMFCKINTVVEPIAHWVSNYNVGHGTKTKLPEIHKNAKNRSKTFPGIARAMAEQWG